MNVTIISPNLYTYGSMLIGGILKDKGHDVTLTKNLSADTDVVLLSLYSTLHLLNKNIKDFVSGSNNTVYVGGPVSAYPDIVLGELDVDAVIIGEGEESTIKLLDHGISENISGIAFRNGDKIIMTEPKPASIERPTPLIPGDIHKQDIRGANAYIETHRGCIGACGFCQVPEFFGKKIRSRRIEDIIHEIKLFKQYGVKRIAISGGTSSLFQYSGDRSMNESAFIELLAQIAEVMGSKNVSVPDIRVDYVNEEILQAIRDYTMGWVYYGIESGSNKILKDMRKGINTQTNIHAIELAREYGVKVGGSFIVGYPSETIEDYELTKDFIEDNLFDDVFISIAEPIPNTNLAERVLRTDDDNNPTFIKHTGEYNILNLTESEARCFDLSLHAEMCKFMPGIITDQVYQTYLGEARQQGSDIRAVTRLLKKYQQIID